MLGVVFWIIVVEWYVIIVNEFFKEISEKFIGKMFSVLGNCCNNKGKVIYENKNGRGGFVILKYKRNRSSYIYLIMF